MKKEVTSDILQITATVNEGLIREFAIKILRSNFDVMVEEHLDTIGKGGHIAGFRPGKLPPRAILQKRFGDSARREALENTVSSASRHLIKMHNLKPIGDVVLKNLQFEDAADVEFTLACELTPEIVLGDLSSIKCERPVVVVDEEMIADGLQTLAKIEGNEEPLPPDSAIVKGDIAEVSFTGTVDDQPVEELTKEEMGVEAGADKLRGDIEDKILGMKVGDSGQAEITFPAQHSDTKLRGKMAVLSFKITKATRVIPHVIDDELAKKHGAADLAALREKIVDTVTKRYATLSDSIVKRSLFDQLAVRYDFSLPQVLVNEEFTSIWRNLKQAQQNYGVAEEDSGKSEDVLKEEYRHIAERRVRLALLMQAVMEQNKLTVTQEDVYMVFNRRLEANPAMRDNMLEYYRKNPQAVASLRAEADEHKAVEWVLSQVQVTEKPVLATELMRIAQVIA